MANHKQPREVAALKGADKRNPQRYKKAEAKSGLPLGTAPEYMRDEAKAIWFELETYSLTGVLTGSDRLVMEIVSNLVADYRADPSEFTASMHGVLKGHMASLGLNPSDRQKLGVEKPKSSNPFADLEQ